MAVIYEGPSVLDGSPIVVIATGLDRGSKNAKTGNLIQTWILRSDVDPLTASQWRLDGSICGTCPHRRSLGGACYVSLHQAPLSVFRAYKRGSYDRIGAGSLGLTFKGLTVRLGSYGDPAAVPTWVWARVLSESAGHLGYTHQWRTQLPSDLGRFCMASVDTAEEHEAARMLGWRTFRVRQPHEEVKRGEFVCPASEEGGKRVSCTDCGACDGSTKPSRATPVIMAHGALSSRFKIIQPTLQA